MKIIPFRFRLASLLVLLLLPCTSISFAARRRSTNLKTDQGSEKMAKSPDIAFLLKADQSGTAEVQLGKLASEKATSPSVKELGNQMARERGKTVDQLTTFAAQRNMTLSMTMNAKDQGVYDKLQNSSGASFDKIYLKAMVNDHKSDIKLFKNEARKGRDEQIQGFASATLPVLHDHLTRIQSLRASTKAGKSGATR